MLFLCIKVFISFEIFLSYKIESGGNSFSGSDNQLLLRKSCYFPVYFTYSNAVLVKQLSGHRTAKLNTAKIPGFDPCTGNVPVRMHIK